MEKSALLVRAGPKSELIDEFLRSGALFVGWERLGDLSGMSSEDIESALRREYPERRTLNGNPTKHYLEIIQFAIVARPSDIIVTPHSAQGRLLVGNVSGPYAYVADSRIRSSDGEPYRHSLPVDWTHAVSRLDLQKWVFRDTDQRGKTAFWLRLEVTNAIMSAKKLDLIQ